MARNTLLSRLAGNAGAVANARAELALAHQRATDVDLLARRIEVRTHPVVVAVVPHGPASTAVRTTNRRTPAAA
ncbi:MAG: hypothetical protein H0U26_00575 [Acidimicrobiia bacterium]|nr:hypothetical protein [Acidimicrobiia bacterium]